MDADGKALLLESAYKYVVRTHRNRTRMSLTNDAHLTKKKLPAFMPHTTFASFVIIGMTSDGKMFRPSDWAERLCGVMSVFGAKSRMTYSPFVQPGNQNGAKCVFVDARIRDLEPLAYGFLVHFAKDNDLKVEPWTPTPQASTA